MKKALFFLAVLCVAGFFTAKAQSPSDSAYARDLSYTYINANNLPATATGQLTSSSKLLKDIRIGSAANGYTFMVSSAGWYDIDVRYSSLNGIIYLLDANYNAIDSNDDYSGSYHSKMLTQLQAGQYYLLVCNNGSGRLSSSYSYDLAIKTRSNVKDLRTLTYTAKTLGTPIVDTLGANCEIVKDSTTNGYFYFAKGYTMQLPAGYIIMTLDRNNRDVAVFDNNYNLVHDLAYSNTFNVPQSGTYRMVVFSYEDIDNDTSLSTFYNFTIDSVSVATFRTLQYQNISFGTTISDTLRDTDPYLLSHPISITASSPFEMPFAKGFKIQTPATISHLDFVVDSGDYDSYIFLLDANKNLITQNDDDCYFKSRIVFPVNPSSTYYLVVSSYYYNETGWFHFYTRGIQSLPTLYVDGVNGDDARNGLTAGTAIKTLDTAIARTGAVGKYLMTDDYTFKNLNALRISYAEIYPYGKDINLKISNNIYNDLTYIYGSMIFGEQGGNYYFILDSNRSDNFDDFIDADYLGSYLEVNNLKVRNSYLPSSFIWGDKVVMNNCEFTNDTIYDEFIAIDEYGYNEIKLTNCTFSQNIFYDNFIYHYYDSLKFTMENTNVSGNTFDNYYINKFTRATINLTSGSWRNNNLASAYSDNGNPNLSTQNCAGIWSYYTTINIGAGFTMDANNYLCIDSASRLNITENLSGNNVAQVYPFEYDYDNYEYVADYYEGRRVLWGTSSLLANNYQKFGIAQADNSTLWYIHPDGTIHSWPVSIDLAEESTISLYPNPANDVLNIALQGTEVNEAVVIDIYGKTVARTTVSEGNNTLDISALPAGMYFVQLRADNNVKATQKIVKR